MLKPEAEGWLTTAQAAQLLNITSGAVCRYAKGKNLTCFQGGTGQRKKYWFRAEEIQALAQAPERLKRERKQTERAERLKRMREHGLGADEEVMLTTRQAAEILQISRVNLTQYVRNHRLFAAQSDPGKMGSRYLFPRSVIEAFRVCERRIAKRQRIDRRGGNYRSAGSGQAPAEAWLTTLQVCDWLQISAPTLTHLRKSGKVGYVRQYGRTDDGHACWRYLYRKADILVYIATPAYQEGRRRFAKAEQTMKAKAEEKFRKANGLDTKPPPTPVERKPNG